MSQDGFVMIDSTQASQPEMPAIFELPKLNGHDMFEISVDQVQHLYSSNAFSAVEYTKFCLNRIQATNQYLEAVIETNPEALSIAHSLDEERKHGQVRGPLHGIPVLVKDVCTSSLSFYC
jgi:amidase